MAPCRTTTPGATWTATLIPTGAPTSTTTRVALVGALGWGWVANRAVAAIYPWVDDQLGDENLAFIYIGYYKNPTGEGFY